MDIGTMWLSLPGTAVIGKRIKTSAFPFVYRKYPKIREALSRRCAVYNEQLEMVERMEEEGNITVIRPRKPVVVDRIERDIHKLTDLYEEGYECAKQQFEVG